MSGSSGQKPGAVYEGGGDRPRAGKEDDPCRDAEEAPEVVDCADLNDEPLPVEVTGVGASLVYAADEGAHCSDNDDGNDGRESGVDEFLRDITPEGEDTSYKDRVRDLDRFYASERVLSHKEAVAALMEMVPKMQDIIDVAKESAYYSEECAERADVFFDEEDEGAVIDLRDLLFGLIPHESVYSTREVLSKSGDRGKLEMIRALNRKVAGEFARKRYPFLRVPAALADSRLGVKTALKCPRAIGSDQKLSEFGIPDEALCPEGALLYQLVFLRAAKKASAKRDGYRWAYSAAQIGASLSQREGREASIPPTGRLFKAPSLNLFSELEKGLDSKEEIPDEVKKKIRTYIDAMLSLIMPDKEVEKSFLESGHCRAFVQEDFISVDLMALAQKYSLYSEYENVFKALFRVRQAAYLKAQHLKSYSGADSAEDPERERQSLVDVIERFVAEHGRKPRVASIGYGDGFLEQILLKKGLVESLEAVDLMNSEERVAGQQVYADGKSYVAKVEVPRTKKILVKGPDGVRRIGYFHRVCPGEDDDSTRIDRVFDCFGTLGRPDIVVCADVLHETEAPYAYAKRAMDLAEYGLYYTDPIRCRATDGLSEVSTWPFDGTRHPASMLPFEDHGDLIAHQTLRRGKMDYLGVSPYSYNDTAWRISVFLEKLPPSTPVDYQLPSEQIDWDQPLLSDEEIFQVWPLSLVPEEERETVVLTLNATTFMDFSSVKIDGGPMKFGHIKRCIAKWLLSASCRAHDRVGGGSQFSGTFFEWENFETDRFIERVSPHGEYLPRLLTKVGDDPRLREFNMYAGEAIAVACLLKEVFSINIEDGMRETPGWENFELQDAA